MSLITVIPAADVTAEYAAEAKEWPIWDSKTYPKKVQSVVE